MEAVEREIDCTCNASGYLSTRSRRGVSHMGAVFPSRQPAGGWRPIASTDACYWCVVLYQSSLMKAGTAVPLLLPNDYHVPCQEKTRLVCTSSPHSSTLCTSSFDGLVCSPDSSMLYEFFGRRREGAELQSLERQDSSTTDTEEGLIFSDTKSEKRSVLQSFIH
jgi:hypothetical protein